MDKEQRVVAVLPVRYMVNAKRDTYAARIRELGLTAYGATKEESLHKAKRIFAAYVAAYRKRGTLAEQLSKSKLTWCWEEDYVGDVELFDSKGEIGILHCKSQKDPAWTLIGELAIA